MTALRRAGPPGPVSALPVTWAVKVSVASSCEGGVYRFGYARKPQCPHIQAQSAVDRAITQIDDVVNSDIARIFTLTSPAADWARHGVEHPLGADFTGVQDLIPQLIDEQTALSYAAKVPTALVKELFAVGTPDEVVDQLAEFRDHGLRHLVVGNAGAIQPSLRRSAMTTAPYVKVVRALRKL